MKLIVKGFLLSWLSLMLIGCAQQKPIPEPIPCPKQPILKPIPLKTQMVWYHFRDALVPETFSKETLKLFHAQDAAHREIITNAAENQLTLKKHIGSLRNRFCP